MPSICSVAPVLGDIGAFPSTINPPQKPLAEVSSKFAPVFSPSAISSATEVKIIGLVAVPAALIVAPFAITSTEAFGPTPTSPFIRAPGLIVSVTPSFTITLFLRIELL